MDIQISKINIICVKWLLPLYVFRYFLHIIKFYRMLKHIRIDDDLNNECHQYITSEFDRNKSFYHQLVALCWAFSYDPYFLSLFYYRLHGACDFLKVIKQDKSTLYLAAGSIGSNIKMCHPFSTIVNAKSIGDNFTIKNNTTIGNNHENNDERPIIGDNVFVGANVVIFGGITVGNNVIIGAGTVVNKDVPSDSIVVGNPCRIIKQGGGNNVLYKK